MSLPCKQKRPTKILSGNEISAYEDVCDVKTFYKCTYFNVIFFYLGFLSRTFMIHRTTGEGGGYLFNSSLPLPPLHRILDISRVIPAESSPLHIAGKRTQTGNLSFPSACRQPLGCVL